LADGSGTNIVEVNKLIKQVSDMQKMMKAMSGGKGMAVMNQMMKGKR
jgi:signal recognition particle GTPase